MFFGPSIPTTELNKDPDDKLGMTNRASWMFVTNSGKMQMTPALFETTYPKTTPDTWSLPLVISAGLDGEMGIYEPYDTAHFGHLAQPQYVDASGNAVLEAMLDNFSNRIVKP